MFFLTCSPPTDKIEHMFDSGNGGDDRSPSDQPLGDPCVVLRSMLDVDLAGLDNTSLCEALGQMVEARNLLDAVTSRLTAEVEKRKATDAEHGLQTASWISRQARLPVGPQRSRVKVSKDLAAHLSPAGAALAAGRINWEHATVLSNLAKPRIRAEFCEMLPQLITIAEHMTFAAWKREVTNIAELLDTEGGHTPGDDISDNVLRLSPMHDNTIVIRGQLCGELALSFRDALAAEADSMFHRMSRDAEATNDELSVPDRATLNALALVELVHRALGADTSSGSAPKADLSLIINAADPHTVTDRDGIVIGDTDRYTCMCDPVFTPIVMNTQGIVTDLGRTQRFASTAQRKAMAHRDGGCVFPGCDRPSQWTDAHHIHHWTRGGPTDLALLASLCRHHHGVTHRKGWSMEATPDQWFMWTTPGGQVIHSQRHGRQRQQGETAA